MGFRPHPVKVTKVGRIAFYALMLPLGTSFVLKSIVIDFYHPIAGAVISNDFWKLPHIAELPFAAIAYFVSEIATLASFIVAAIAHYRANR